MDTGVAFIRDSLSSLSSRLEGGPDSHDAVTRSFRGVIWC